MRCIQWLALLWTGVGLALAGPLRVHPTNSRYFTDDGVRAILLTGSHTWPVIVDMGPSDPPPKFDYSGFLDYLEKHGHNFSRLWTWNNAVFASSKATKTHFVQPLPWRRTGPGNALDGKPKFDLQAPDPDYFERLRSRVALAQKRGIYVSVMFLEGWSEQLMPNAWTTSPFNPKNHVQGIDADLNGDGVGIEAHTMGIPQLLELQKRCIARTIDAINEFDNVLYEIGNEFHPSSVAWQYHLIEFVREYEGTKPKRHPVGMTFTYKGGNNDDLFHSPADWISPNNRGGYFDDPPSADGCKVIIPDTDHLGGLAGTSAWVWKTFLRGMNPIFMDPYDGAVLVGHWDPKWNPVRRSLGHIRRFAERMNLAEMYPQGELSTTRYCLASTGKEYLVYFPEGGEATVNLSGQRFEFAVEWFNPATGDAQAADVHKGGTRAKFTPPFSGPAVLYLRLKPAP